MIVEYTIRQVNPEMPVSTVTVTRVDGKVASMEIPVAASKILKWFGTPKTVRPFAQDYFQELNASQREFLISGITPEEWDEMFKEM